MKDREIVIKKVKPLKIPVKCVVCNGFGTLKFGQLVCHGCKGKGYILVPAEEDNEKFV